jgi:hypothetical protein
MRRLDRVQTCMRWVVLTMAIWITIAALLDGQWTAASGWGLVAVLYVERIELFKRNEEAAE